MSITRGSPKPLTSLASKVTPATFPFAAVAGDTDGKLPDSGGIAEMAGVNEVRRLEQNNRMATDPPRPTPGVEK